MIIINIIIDHQKNIYIERISFDFLFSSSSSWSSLSPSRYNINPIRVCMLGSSSLMSSSIIKRKGRKMNNLYLYYTHTYQLIRLLLDILLINNLIIQFGLITSQINTSLSLFYIIKSSTFVYYSHHRHHYDHECW